jgi:thioredoxin-like negative regulator of GroEL
MLSNRKPAIWSRSRWWKLVLPLTVIVAVSSLAARRMSQVDRYQKALGEAKSQMAAGRHGVAARTLATLLAWKPDSDEAVFLLGLCEKARGRAAEAAQAWGRLRPESPFWVSAVQNCRDLNVERGLLAEAEQVLNFASQRDPDHGFVLYALFVPIYCYQGRVEDANRAIEAEWNEFNRRGEGTSERAIHLVWLHLDVKTSVADPQPARDYLARAARAAPGDDRVWLGRANLAIRDGSLDLAKQLLDACLERHPDDVPVWTVKLSHAVATIQPGLVRQALEHLPADQSTPAQIHKLAAWIARHEDNLGSEERALERLVQADPADLAALTRLAELAEKQGRKDRGADLGRQKNEIERLQARLDKLRERRQPIRDAVELAQLAAKLGLGFEARAFLTIAIAGNPRRGDLRDELLRQNRTADGNAPPGMTLAKAVNDELAQLGYSER